MIQLTEEEIINLVTDYHFSAEQNRHILANNVAKAQLKKVYDEYECKECSTPGFVHLVFPRQDILEEVK